MKEKRGKWMKMRSHVWRAHKWSSLPRRHWTRTSGGAELTPAPNTLPGGLCDEEATKGVLHAVLFASGAFATSEVSSTPLLTAQAQSIGLSIVDQDIDTRTSGTAFADLIDARTASQAVAQFGTLRALGQAVDIPPVPSHSTAAAAAASWADDVTLDAAGLIGQVGTVTVQYRIDGSMSVDSAASARSNYSFFVRRGQLFDNVSVGNWEIGVGASGTDFMSRTISATFPIVFGAERQWTFAISLQSTVFGIVQGASAVVDMSDTALWLGISEVRDAAGSLVSTYDVTSTSGTDWSQSVLQAVPEQPVPEPSALSPLLRRCAGDFRGCVETAQ